MQQKFSRLRVRNLVKAKKKVLTLHNEMSCIMNFLSLLIAILEQHHFLLLKEYVCRLSAAYELQSTALDPDYDLFIGYQMPDGNYEGLNACLCLLPKNLKNFAKLVL